MKIHQLLEARQAPLYHTTGIGNAVKILKTNAFEDKTAQWIDGRYINGTSTTRSKHFADQWGSVTFVLDQEKINQTNKIIPIDYFANPSCGLKQSVRQKNEGEAEEFVIGKIANADKVIKEILVKEDAVRFARKYDSYDSNIIEYLVNHPKVKMI